MNKRCRNQLKDALPCTENTSATDSNEMNTFQVSSPDLGGATCKSDQRLLNKTPDQDDDWINDSD